jgi:hypothetical protein
MTLARIKSIDKDTGHTGSLLVKSHQASPASGYPPAWNAGQREYYYHRKSCKRELMQQISHWWNVHSISMSAAAFRNNRFEFTIGSRILLKNKTQYPSVELWIHFCPVSFCGANSRYFSNFRHHLRGEWSWRIALLLTAFVCKSGNWIVLLPPLLFVKKLAIFNLRSSRIFQNTHSICRITEIQNSSLRLNKFIRGFSTIKSFFKMADG